MSAELYTLINFKLILNDPYCLKYDFSWF